MPLEMVSCGKCERCLAGGRVHGPYRYRWEGSGKRRRHLYGGGEESLTLALQRLRGMDESDEEEIRQLRDEAERLQEEAERDAEEREKKLTPRQREKRDGIMVLQARLRRAAWWLREVEKSNGASKKKPRKKKPNLIEQGMKELGKQTSEQLRYEIKSIRRQIKQEKKELQKMLS